MSSAEAERSKIEAQRRADGVQPATARRLPDGSRPGEVGSVGDARDRRPRGSRAASGGESFRSEIEARQRAIWKATPLYLRVSYRFGQVVVGLGIVLMLVASAGIVGAEEMGDLYSGGYLGFLAGFGVVLIGEGVTRLTRL
jgi:hypothetical protein